LEDTVEELLDKMKKYARENKVPIIMDESANLLEIILKALKPKRILEIGTAIGYSSIIFAKTMNEDGHMDTIEINPNMVSEAWKNTI